MVMSELVRQLSEMGEIWEIILPQSGPHSCFSEASPSILTHTGSSELLRAAKHARNTGMEIESETEKSVFVCLIGFFQIRLNPITCLSTCFGIAWSAGRARGSDLRTASCKLANSGTRFTSLFRLHHYKRL